MFVGSPSSQNWRLTRETVASGLTLFAQHAAGVPRWWDSASRFGAFRDAVALLSQLEEEGLAQEEGGRLLLTWDAIYALLRSPDYQDSASLLGLPELIPATPRLASRGGLTDSTFTIAVAGWENLESGQPLKGERHGALLEVQGRSWLMPEASWRVADAVARFAELPQKTPEVN